MEQCSEAEALSDWCDEYEDDEDWDGEPFEFYANGRRVDPRSLSGHKDQIKPYKPVDQGEVVLARSKYNLAKSAKVGDTVCCAGCGKKFIKTTYNKTFCSNGRTVKGKSSCKDRYHNMVTPSRLDRLNLKTF